MGQRALRRVALIGLLSLGANALADGLAYTVSKNAIQFGERSRIEFSLPISALGLAKYDDESELPVLNDDLVMDSKHVLVLERDFRREKDTLVWRFDVTSYEKGKVIVPPVEIKFGPHTFSSEAVPLEVATSRPDSDKALRPDFGLASYPIDWKFWLTIAAALAAGLALAYWARKKRLWIKWISRWRRLTEKRGPQEEPAESWLRRELTRLRTRLVRPEEGFPPLVDDLTSVLRVFFRRKTNQPADSWTTNELKAKLPAGTLPEPLVPVLQKADLFKFRGKLASDDSDPAKEIVTPGIETSERALL